MLIIGLWLIRLLLEKGAAGCFYADYLFELKLDKLSFQLLPEGIFAEIYARVLQNAFEAEVVSPEYCRFGLPVNLADTVDGLLRNDQMTWNDDGNRVEGYCMSHGAYSGAVVAEIGEICVAEKSDMFRCLH